MNKDILMELHSKIVEDVKGDFTLVQMGSSVVPWISKPHDVDCVYFFNNPKDTLLAGKNLLKYKKNIPETICPIIRFNANVNNPKYPLWAYNMLFARNIIGEKENIYLYNNMKKALNNLNTEVKKELAKDVYFFLHLYCYTKDFDNNPKILYHVYIWKCLLEKGNLNLTEEEGRMVNDLHDRKFSKEELDRMKEGFEEFFRQYL